MPKRHDYKFCFGPWNLSEGQDPYGPTTRPPQTFDWKLAQLKKLGFDAMMFHDDDAIPDIDGKSDAQIRREAKELKKRLDDSSIAAEMVAPRLWFSPMTIDGAYTSNDPKCRKYAIERSLRSIDIANYLDTDILVLWLAREGTYLRESKNGRRSVDLLVEAFDKMLGHDKKIRLAIEPKPNEPMDHAYLPTIGHALAIAQLTRAPKRIGCLIESAHAILAFLDPPTIQRALADPEKSPSNGRKIDRRALQRELNRIRSDGYARSVGERVPTAIGLAVPVFGADGRVVGSISVTYPENRMDERHNRRLIVLLRDGAREMSASLGWIPESEDGDPYRLIKH